MTEVIRKAKGVVVGDTEPFVVGATRVGKTRVVETVLIQKNVMLVGPTRMGKSSAQQTYFEKLWHYQGSGK